MFTAYSLHHPDEPSDCHGHKECDVVSAAIQDIGKYFDKHICHAFHDVNCALHVLPSDEQICATDGVTYSNQ